MSGNESQGALSGLTVLDLSFWAPGRGTSMVLGDLGAEVICVEMPRGMRAEYAEDDTNDRWLLYQRNKRSVTLNLKTEGGKRVFRRLAEKADIVIESYKPGAAARLQADYETVRAINPRVIYCSISGFGQTGPYSQLIGHEVNYQGLSGALYENRWDGCPPTVLSVLAADLIGGGTNALVGILAALYHREQTGQGQYIDIAVTAGILPFTGIWPYAHWTNDEHRVNSSASSGKRPAFRAYPTKDGRWVAMTGGGGPTWERLCRAAGRPDLLDHPPADTEEGRAEWNRQLTELFESKTRDEWAELNLRENVAVTPVLDSVEEVETDPQMVHRQAIKEIDYGPIGRVKQIRTQIDMSETPVRVEWISRYGQDTETVFAELGFTTEDLEALRVEGACE